jgi:hypothetical protein
MSDPLVGPGGGRVVPALQRLWLLAYSGFGALPAQRLPPAERRAVRAVERARLSGLGSPKVGGPDS